MIYEPFKLTRASVLHDIATAMEEQAKQEAAEVILRGIMTKLEEAAKRGYYSIDVDVMTSHVETPLIEAGYTVEFIDGGRDDPDYYRVSFALKK